MTTYSTDSVGKYCKFIPATQRPDGTWRKARRVRDGYIPQEEVPLYESVGKKFSSKKSDLPVGMCPLVAQATKEKRDKTKKKEASPGIIILPKNTTQPPKKLSTVNNCHSKSNANSISNTSQENQNVSLNNVEHLAASAPITTNNTKKPPSSQSLNANESQADRLAENLKDLQLYEEQEMSKKIRKLKKKVREIEVIETKLKSGELKNPDKDQLEKVKRKIDILKEISNLESKFRPKD
ncbi:WIBG family protein [Megaselia abdita]